MNILKDNEFEHKMKMVYIIENEHGYIKIGISQDVNRRIRTISSQSGFAIHNIFFTDPCSNYYEIEHDMHEYFSKQRIKGEWFSADFLYAKNVLCDMFEYKANRIPRKGIYVQPEDIMLITRCKDKKENKLLEYIELIKYISDNSDITDKQKIMMCERVFEKFGLKTEVFNIIREIVLK